jgi:hypothetical protein
VGRGKKGVAHFPSIVHQAIEPSIAHQTMEPFKGHQAMEPSKSHQVGIFLHLLPFPSFENGKSGSFEVFFPRT